MPKLVFKAEEHALGVSGDNPVEVRFCAVGDPDVQFASGVVEGAIPESRRADSNRLPLLQLRVSA
jgi:hypothetical protein